MSQIEVSALEGRDLDRWVALALGWEHLGAIGATEPTTDGTPFCRSGGSGWWRSPEGEVVCGPCTGVPYRYSEDWGLAGPIIEQKRISVIFDEWGECWEAYMKPMSVLVLDCDPGDGEGSTPLIAAMRAIVAAKFGDRVEELA